MKIASILAGVAIAALTASAASAEIKNYGQFTSGGVSAPSGPFNAGTPGNFNVWQNEQIAKGLSLPAGSPSTANVSAWSVYSNSGGMQGTASPSDGATFTLQGNVQPSCIFYSGDNTTQVLDFGVIGIWADENAGPDKAFRMTSIPYFNIDTNLAGCNTSNRVTLSKKNLENTSAAAAGYDTSVFTKEIKFDVTANYKAGAKGDAAVAVQKDQLKLLQNDTSASAEHGAWRSRMNIYVNVPNAGQALVAGDYEGEVKIELLAI